MTTVTVYQLDARGNDIDGVNISEDRYLKIVEKYIPKTLIRYGEIYDAANIVNGFLYGILQERLISRRQYFELREQVKYIEIQLNH